MLRHIRPLPPEVIQKIAAGEVITRPSAVVKELIENALDAGAREVRIDVEGNGLECIRVVDDGHGIPAAQVELAFQRHATSKIESAADLFSVTTLGFRGEALASIAAVADVRLETRAIDEESGRSVEYATGMLVGSRRIVRRPGTAVTVRDLFASLPPRRESVRRDASERLELEAVARRYALARPEVRFCLHVDGREVLRTSGTGRCEEVLLALYGPRLAQMMTPLEGSEDGAFRGFISGPALSRPDRREIHLFVNGRPVQNRSLVEAIEQGYRPFRPRGRHPIVALWLDVAPERLDVNVHPAKLEVRLHEEARWRRLLTESVRATARQAVSAFPAAADLTLATLDLSRAAPAEAGDAPVPAPSGRPRWRLIGSSDEGLIIAQGAEGLYLIDQHRAHERVIFDSWREPEQEPRVAVRELVEPVIVELRPAVARLLALRLPDLAEAGFVLEHFGGHTFLVRSLPSLIEPGTLDALLSEAGEASDGTWRDRLFASLACRAAVRKGTRLPESEQERLLASLLQTEITAVCPHGAPVLVQISERFLRRQFGW